MKRILIYITILIVSIISMLIIIRKAKISSNSKENVFISKTIEDECTQEFEKEKIVSVASVKEKVSADAKLILKKYYKQCDHTTNETVEIPQEIVNMEKEDVEKQYPDWKVIGFEQDKIILYKEFEDICGEHYKLKAENGRINIYTINKNGIETLYQRTDISSEYLPEIDLNQMNGEGIEVDGKQELNRIIEDFE